MNMWSLMPISAAMLVVWCRPSTAVTRAIVFSRRRPRGVLARELSRGFSVFFAPLGFFYALFGLFCAVRQCLWAPFLALLRIWPTLPLAEFGLFSLGIARSSVLVFAFINRNCCRKSKISVDTEIMPLC